MSDNSQNEYYMLKAIKCAKRGISQGQTPFGACIVNNDQILAIAHNKVWRTTDITAHAEIVAIRAACKKNKSISLKGAVIYSTCEPCPMCFSAIHWAGISMIVYGSSIKDAKKVGFNELAISNLKMKKYGASRISLVKNVLLKENLELFETWADSSKNKVY
ncbi:MAG: nucleoside deaminase [Candidatus Omnitrophica bacterium]|nr:nucleoside deaminase [Candidatus Omnitrophota bacterium]